MSTASPVLASFYSRRSAKARDLTGAGPDAQTLEAILMAAGRAPDHGRLVPFRFLQIAQSQRTKLGDILVKAGAESKPDMPQDEHERLRAKALEGPLLLAMISRIDEDHPKIVSSDQWLTAGCALQNLLLAAHDFGFSAAISSGAYLAMPSVKAAFQLAANEECVSLIALGHAEIFPPERPKPSLSQIFSVWG